MQFDKEHIKKNNPVVTITNSQEKQDAFVLRPGARQGDFPSVLLSNRLQGVLDNTTETRNEIEDMHIRKEAIKPVFFFFKKSYRL